MKVTVTKASDERWLKLMKLGSKTGCHQMPERSFFFRGYQFPVCARCTGVIIGYIVATLTFLNHKFFKGAAIAGSSIMLGDWLLQKAEIKESTNKRRLITGIAGGFGIMSLELEAIRRIGGLRHKN